MIEGPLKGYHHETYVLRLLGGSHVVKVREPRAQILWFDRRCFGSEEELLRALDGAVTRIPQVHDVGGVGLQGFIEGRTLPTRWWMGGRVHHAIFDQIVERFRELNRIKPSMLDGVPRRCRAKDRAPDGDTAVFMERLIVFTEEQVYAKNLTTFGNLFEELGLSDESFAMLRKRMSGLQRRPFCLLHADLHRKNFIVDPHGQLWTIDWELAMLGDPLYDLATHLYLMRYPADQRRRMADAWQLAVEDANPGGSHGMESDLDLLLDFKKAQSVFTDVIRVSLSLNDDLGIKRVALPWAAREVQRVLIAGAEPLGLDDVPRLPQITAALERQRRMMVSI
ncbi:phosphotransferase [Streptomyces nigra]|uniref:phosphotransferase n=1 Tax=Streptomyces nigra TaxID=1827580 RepID=UPI0036C6E164